MVLDEQSSDLQDSIESQAAYASLGLTHNPFPAAGLAPDAPKIRPFPDVRAKIEGFLHSFLRTKQSKGMVILGDFGTGKTYHLRYIQRELEALRGTHIKTVFLDSPGVEPYDLIRGVIREVGEEEVAKGVWAILSPKLREGIGREGQRYFDSFLHDRTVKERDQAARIRRAEVIRTELVSITEEVLSDHRRFLRQFDKNIMMSREKLRDHLANTLLEPGPGGKRLTTNAGVARHLASVCLYDGAPALESWERLTTRSSAATLFPPAGEPEFLQAILRVLLSSGYEYFVLLLDEFEKVPEMELMTAREARRYLDTIRMLIDRSWETLPFAYLIASVDASWRHVEAELDRALPQRFPTVIDLPRLDRAEVAVYLIIEHLNLARRAGKIPEEPLSPFPSNLLELVPPEYRRTARQVLVLCHHLIERAVETNVPEITPDLVSDYLATIRLEASADEHASA